MTTNKLLTRTDLCQRYGVCSETITRWVRSGEFPKPVRLGPGGNGIQRWNPEDIAQYEAQRIREGEA